MSDEEEVVSEEEMSEEEEESAPSSPTRKSAALEDSGPSEAELAMQRRRQIQTAGLDEDAAAMLEDNKKEREQMEAEIQELRKRNEERKQEREEEERRMAERRAEEDARRKAEEEERRRQKDRLEAERREAREKKMAEMQKWKNPPKPNFVITKKAGEGGGSAEVADKESDGVVTGQKTKEQIENEKRNTLSQRIQPLEISGFDSSKLSEKAKELHNLIYRLESEKYDLEVRFKRQQYDMMELAEKARQMTKGGKGKKVQVSDEADKIQELFAGCPAKIEMYSKYERQKDKRNYGSRKTVFAGPVYGYPAPRINPKRSIVWDDAGLPQYIELEGQENAEPQAEEAAE